MPNKVQTVQSLAGELSNALVRDKRNDGKEFTKLRDGSPAWMTEVIRTLHGDKLPDDTVYEFIDRAASVLADSVEGDDEDQIRELIDQMEPDPYTHDLTAWLHARVGNVYYMTEVLEEYGGSIADGFQILAMAQQKQIHEVAYALLAELQKMVEAQEDTDGN